MQFSLLMRVMDTRTMSEEPILHELDIEKLIIIPTVISCWIL